MMLGPDRTTLYTLLMLMSFVICLSVISLLPFQIIILDEATASLDDETEQKIQKTVTETFVECTVLIIAHRLRTILSCDRVLVLDDGKVSTLPFKL